MYSGGFFLARRALIGLNIKGLMADPGRRGNKYVHDANVRNVRTGTSWLT